MELDVSDMEYTYRTFWLIHYTNGAQINEQSRQSHINPVVLGLDFAEFLNKLRFKKFSKSFLQKRLKYKV